MGVKHAPRPIGPFHHGRDFTSFGAPVDLTAQASPTPQCCAGKLTLQNEHATNASTVVVRSADNVQFTYFVPANSSRDVEDVAYREISSVGGTGTPRVVAYWADIV